MKVDGGLALSWLEAGIWGAFSLTAGAIAWLFRADGAAALRMEELVAEAREAAESDDRRRQDDLRDLNRTFQDHRGEILSRMWTKDDAAAMERRIMMAIRDRGPARGTGERD